MQSYITPIDGYTLACRVLDHPGGGVAQLIELARGGETDWLELKAAMTGRPQDRLPGEKDADAYWHVAKAVLSMANTRGGAVIIGVEDQTLKAVGLQAGDPRNVIEKEGIEAYRRKEILERIAPANGEWATGRQGKWRLESGRLPKDLVEIRGQKYQDQNVAVILVKPIENPCIRVWENQVEQILHRAPGNLGKVEPIVGSRAMQYFEESRQIRGEDLHHLWERFCGKRMVRIFISSPEDVAEEREKAREVITRLQKNFAGKLSLSPVFWEDLPLPATSSFQDGIDCLVNDRDGIDIAIFIVWSRLGSSPGGHLKKADGAPYRSGTEREFDLMLEAREKSGGKRPDILFYRRLDDEGFARLKDGQSNPQIRNELEQQKNLLDDFIRTEFKDPETGENIRAYLTFDSPITFSGELYRHLKNRLTDYLEEQFSSIEWEGNPYQGLEAFTEEQHPIYFGREENTGEFLNLLKDRKADQRPTALVIGASGSGKSSFVQAGIIPSLRSDNSPATLAVDWRICSFTPSQCEKNPKAFLARKLTSDGILPALNESLDEEESIAEAEADFSAYFRLCIKSALRKEATKKQHPVAVLLVVDQLEEIFTTCSEEARKDLLQVLEIISSSPDFAIIATLRNDFYPELQQEQTLWNLFQPDGIYPLNSPDITDLQRIITLPAKMAGYRFESENEKDLDQEILSEIKDGTNALPLLEYLLSELTQRTEEDKILRFADYREIGGLRGAIGNRAEEIFQKHGGEKVQSELFQALVQTDSSDEGTPVRRKAPAEGLCDTPEKEEVVTALIEARLLVSDEKTVSIAHEALFSHWPRFRHWLMKNNQALIDRRNVEYSFVNWKKNNLRKDYLIQGRKPIADAENLLQQHWYFLNQEIEEYIDKSIKHAHRGERLWKVAAAFMFLAVVGLFGTSAYAFHSFRIASSAAERANLASIEAEEARILAEEQKQRAIDLAQEREKELNHINQYLNPILHHALTGSGDMELRLLATELYEETNQLWVPRYDEGDLNQMINAALTAQLQANQVAEKNAQWLLSNAPLDEKAKEELLSAAHFVNQMEVIFDTILESKEFAEIIEEEPNLGHATKMTAMEAIMARGVIKLHSRNIPEAIYELKKFIDAYVEWEPSEDDLQIVKLYDIFEASSNLSHAYRVSGDMTEARNSANLALKAGFKMLNFNQEKAFHVAMRYLMFNRIGMLSKLDHEPFKLLIKSLPEAPRTMLDEVDSILDEFPEYAFHVKSVTPNSPAELNGIAPNDLILSWADWSLFNERFPLGDMGLYEEIDRSLEEPKSITVYRDGGILTFEVPSGLIGANIVKTESYSADSLREIWGQHQNR